MPTAQRAFRALQGLIIALAFSLLAGCASSPPAATYRPVAEQETKRVEKEMCEKVSCVFNARIVLKKKDGTIFDKTYSSLPTVQPEGVSVYAGQTIQFEADVENDHLTRFVPVDAVQHPEKTLSATLKQVDDGSMTLVVKNPFDRNIKIAMAMMPLDHDSLLTTSSCPVIAHGANYELWPYPIFQIWLGNIRLLDASDKMVCSE